jgi:hypothetical protein
MSMLGTVDIKLRPLRFAFLVDPGNAQQAREAIRLASTLWGGAYCPIIPLYKRMPKTWRDPIKAPPAKSVVLGYVDAFDPDVLVQLSVQLPAYLTDAKRRIITPQDVWRTLDDRVAWSPQWGIGVFELFDAMFQEFFKYKSKYPPWMLLPKLPAKMGLFWASVFGDLPSKIADLVRRHHAEPLEIQETEFKVEALGEFMRVDALFPRRWTQYGLNVLGGRKIRGDAAVYFMDGESLEDIIDFWNLRATGRPVLPLPKQFNRTPQFERLITSYLKEHRVHWRHDPKVCEMAHFIRSRHSTMDEMQAYAKTLKLEIPKGDTSADGFFALQHWYPRVWDEWARDKDDAVPRDTYAEPEASIDIEEPRELSVRFKPLLPSFADKDGIHSEGRCANDIEFRFYGAGEYLAEVFPSSSGPHSERAISGLGASDWRIGRHGLVKIVANDLTETRDVPSAESIVFAWLTDLGWKPALSSAGLLAKQMYRTLDGQPFALQNPKLIGLLERMNGGLVKDNLEPVNDNKITQERDMPVAELKNRVQSFGGRGDLYGYLLNKRILRLGLRMQCPHCTRHSWFPLDAVRDTFSCPRCLNVFPALDNLESSLWSYKTAGPFSVPNYADGAYAVLLTVQAFDDRKMTTMRITPALSFTAEKGGAKLEADFALFWQEALFGERKEGLAFGECKTYRQFEERDFRRMREIGEAFPGAVLVFSTLRKELTEFEIRRISSIAKRGRKYWKSERPLNPVLILTGTELLSFRRAPHCWDDALKQRFSHVRGLMDLCNATQQIYLKLPSWHTDWQEKWEKRRRRLQAAPEQATP